MTAVLQPSSVSIEDYLAGEKISEVKHEYLGGAVHAMAGGTNDHNSISFNALFAIGKRLEGMPCRPFNSDTKIRIEFSDHTRFYYPDGQIVCNSNSGSDSFQEQPVVVIEILSESTRRTDMGEKRDAYLTVASLKVLILAESTRPYAVVYRRRPTGGFAAEEYSGLAEVIGLHEIDAALPLAELYERIEFPS